jgi:hypothetical protein
LCEGLFGFLVSAFLELVVVVREAYAIDLPIYKMKRRPVDKPKRFVVTD